MVAESSPKILAPTLPVSELQMNIWLSEHLHVYNKSFASSGAHLLTPSLVLHFPRAGCSSVSLSWWSLLCDRHTVVILVIRASGISIASRQAPFPSLGSSPSPPLQAHALHSAFFSTLITIQFSPFACALIYTTTLNQNPNLSFSRFQHVAPSRLGLST